MRAVTALFLFALARPALAANLISVMEPSLDPATVVSLGVQLPFTGDDNGDATVTLRYRKTGTSAYRAGLPLYRVHPENVAVNPPPLEFAGSVLDLQPATSYDLELHVVDPDGADVIKTLTAQTAPVPADPPSPHAVNVADQASLQTAVSNAAPGDVIVLANGTYGPYLSVSKGGTAGNPVVIRGASQAGVVFDAGGCTACNALEYYNAGYVHLENLTIQNAQRAVRVQTNTTTGNVFRRLRITNVVLGITTNADANGYYVADNVLEGRLSWPSVYKDDSGAHANDDGINIKGSGNVIAHNRISGFGDAMKTEQDRVRANDFYGNDVLWTYDNGIELDTSQGNVRAFRNRWTNNSTPTSFQPIEGGPAYLFRNVIVNVADEPFKLHALGGVGPPTGGFILHNTVVKAGSSLQLSTPDVAKGFVIENNLFVANPSDGYAVRWDTPVVDPSVRLDYNGYSPDGMFEYGYSNSGTNKTYASFSAVQGSGRFETHGVLVAASNFASALATPSTYQPQVAPPDVTLAAGSLAIDRGVVFANINDDFSGAAPDLGALERGCPVPSYGPRAAGVDESNTRFDCSATDGGTASPDAGQTPPDGGTAMADAGPPDGGSQTGGPDAGSPDAGTSTMGATGSCGCTSAGPSMVAALLALAFVRRRRASLRGD